MRSFFLRAIALAALVAGPVAVTVPSAALASDQVAQSSKEQECSKIENPQARAACLKRQDR